MKPTAILVNIARGQIIDEAALVEALRRGRIAGAGIDVCKTEPLPEDSPLWDVPNLIITPHCAGYSPRRSRRLAEFFCANLRRYLRNEPLLNLVDTRLGYPVPGGSPPVCS
jgi:D-3-phosphoglycerate dehydrogenase